MKNRGRWSFLFSRLLHIVVVVAVVSVVGIKIAHRWVSTKPEPAVAADVASATNTEELRRLSERAFEAEDWERLVATARKLAELSPDDAFGWVRLAYGLHQLEKWNDALSAYSRCCDFPQAHPWALYHMAVISARLRRDREAIDFLRDSFRLGHRPKGSVLLDPDFRHLLSNEEFLEVVAKIEPLTKRPADEQLRFLAGKWTVLDRNDNVVGAVEFEEVAGGLAWRGTYIGDDGELATLTYYFDPSKREWSRLRIDGAGTVERTSGKVERGSRGHRGVLGKLTLYGDRVGVDGTKQKIRVRLLPNSFDEVMEIVELSSDDGKTWVTDWTVTFSRPTSFSSHL